MITSCEINMQGSRDYQEDSLGIRSNEDQHIFVVADGLGGHGLGAEASAIAVEQALAAFDKELEPDEFFLSAFQSANRKLVEEQAVQKNQKALKTTMVACLVKNAYIYGAYIGDSRMYVFDQGRMLLRTLDHSVPQMLVLSGELKESQIRNHPDRNRVLRVLGEDREQVKYQMTEPQEAAPGKSILLCTDGFWELVTEKEMEKELKKAKDVKDWVYGMHRVHMRKGKKVDKDNYTAIGIWIR